MKGVCERWVVQLDEVASKLLRRYTQRKHIPAIHSGADPRDVASAAVVFLLGEDDGNTGGLLHEATSRREKAEGRLLVQSHPPVAVDVDVEAAKLLGQYCRETGQDARDVASGMLYSMLACVLWDESYSGDECTRSAKARRLSRAERVKQKTVSAPSSTKPKAWKSRQNPERKGGE